jgi:hypothetical protein
MFFADDISIGVEQCVRKHQDWTQITMKLWSLFSRFSPSSLGWSVYSPYRECESGFLGKAQSPTRGKARLCHCKDPPPHSRSPGSQPFSFSCIRSRLDLPLELSNCNEAAYAPKSPSVWLLIVALFLHRAQLLEVPFLHHQATLPHPHRISTLPNQTIRTLSCTLASPCCWVWKDIGIFRFCSVAP